MVVVVVVVVVFLVVGGFHWRRVKSEERGRLYILHECVFVFLFFSHTMLSENNNFELTM